MSEERQRMAAFLDQAPNVVYAVWLDLGERLACKVGHSSNFLLRINQMACGMPGTPCYYCLISAPSKGKANDRERVMQYALQPFRKHGEWFSSPHGQALVGAWCCAYDLARTIAMAEDSGGMRLSGFAPDWGFYKDNPNPTAELIEAVIHIHRSPFEQEAWLEVADRFGYE